MATTDATVYDELHALFGAGEYVGDGTDWHKYRMTEISKIKAYRSKRNTDPSDLVIAARWCRAHGIWIRAHWQLYEHLQDALRDDRAGQAQEQVADLEDAIQKAIEIEASVPDSPWLDRLIRAAGKAREEVYGEWRRGSSNSPWLRGSAVGAS